MLCTCGVALMTIIDVNRKSCGRCWVIPVPPDEYADLRPDQRWVKRNPDKRREIPRLGQKRRWDAARKKRERRMKKYEWKE